MSTFSKIIPGVGGLEGEGFGEQKYIIVPAKTEGDGGRQHQE